MSFQPLSVIDWCVFLLQTQNYLSFQSACNVTVILESEIVWEKFRAGTGSVEPYIIFFPNYSKGKESYDASQRRCIHTCMHARTHTYTYIIRIILTSGF